MRIKKPPIETPDASAIPTPLALPSPGATTALAHEHDRDHRNGNANEHATRWVFTKGNASHDTA